MKFKSGRGGKRKGSGRPNKGEKTAVIRCHIDLMDFFKRINKDYQKIKVMPILGSPKLKDNSKSKVAINQRIGRLNKIDTLLKENYSRRMIANILGVSISTIDRAVMQLNKKDIIFNKD